MIVIVDYGMGNLRSVHKALERVGFQASVTQDPAEVKKAAGLIVPGVGAFKKAMENLQELGLVNPIIEFVESGKPFLGICLGLQLLFSGSDEFGFQKGLSLFKGRVVRFPFSHPAASPPKDLLKVPHMGWNTVHIHKRPLGSGRNRRWSLLLFRPFLLPDSRRARDCSHHHGLWRGICLQR